MFVNQKFAVKHCHSLNTLKGVDSCNNCNNALNWYGKTQHLLRWEQESRVT